MRIEREKLSSGQKEATLPNVQADYVGKLI